MRRSFGLAVTAIAVVFAACAADNDEAAKTRSEKLAVKVTVEWKNTPLSDALAELTSAVKDADKGKLEFKLATGISGNQKVNFKAKDKSIADVLDGALGKDQGYVIQPDGLVQIKSGAERGEAAKGDTKMAAKGGKDKTEKTATKDKPMPKEKTEPKEKPAAKPAPEEKAEPTADQKEKQAYSKLDLIKQLAKDGMKDKARRRLEELIQSFPDTKAATEAKEMLEKLK
jgi:hypothetical protein